MMFRSARETVICDTPRGLGDFCLRSVVEKTLFKDISVLIAQLRYDFIDDLRIFHPLVSFFIESGILL